MEISKPYTEFMESCLAPQPPKFLAYCDEGLYLEFQGASLYQYLPIPIDDITFPDGQALYGTLCATYAYALPNGEKPDDLWEQKEERFVYPEGWEIRLSWNGAWSIYLWEIRVLNVLSLTGAKLFIQNAHRLELHRWSWDPVKRKATDANTILHCPDLPYFHICTHVISRYRLDNDRHF